MDLSNIRLKTLENSINKSIKVKQPPLSKNNKLDNKKSIMNGNSSSNLINKIIKHQHCHQDNTYYQFVKYKKLKNQNKLEENQKEMKNVSFCNDKANIFNSDSNKSQCQQINKTKKKQNKKRNLNESNKKHSKSMLNSIDYKNEQYIDNQGKSSLKHNKSIYQQHTKPVSNPHNKSVHGHHISTSSATKRRKSIYLKPKSSLSDQKLEQKFQNFLVVQKCLKAYLKQKDNEQSQESTQLIITMIKAFSKSELNKLSKPLNKLITSMIGFIQEVLKKKQIQKKLYQTPCKKVSQTFQFKQIDKSYSQKNKVKLSQFLTDSFQNSRIKKQNYEQYRPSYPIDLSKAKIKTLQHNLSSLQYESEQLKSLVQQQLKADRHDTNKKQQIKKLRQLLKSQNQIMNQIQQID